MFEKPKRENTETILRDEKAKLHREIRDSAEYFIIESPNRKCNETNQKGRHKFYRELTLRFFGPSIVFIIRLGLAFSIYMLF